MCDVGFVLVFLGAYTEWYIDKEEKLTNISPNGTEDIIGGSDGSEELFAVS